MLAGVVDVGDVDGLWMAHPPRGTLVSPSGASVPNRRVCVSLSRALSRGCPRGLHSIHNTLTIVRLISRSRRPHRKVSVQPAVAVFPFSLSRELDTDNGCQAVQARERGEEGEPLSSPSRLFWGAGGRGQRAVGTGRKMSRCFFSMSTPSRHGRRNASVARHHRAHSRGSVV